MIVFELIIPSFFGRIINHPLAPELTMKIVALAGSGKTSTLRGLCLKNPHLRFLLVVFNKGAQLHARATFPNNAHCFTVHKVKN